MATRNEIAGIVFDMDGTLVHNMDFHRRSWLSFLERYGIRISDREFHEKNVGIISEIVPRFFSQPLTKEEIIRLGREKEALYREMYAPHITALPGLEVFLKRLRALAVRTALATAADQENIDFTIDALNIRNYFDATTGSEEVTHGKPDPEVYLLSCRKLGLDPSVCLAFEDSPSGIRAAHAAGMRVVGVATTHSREELMAFPLHGIISDYTELDADDLIKIKA